MEKIINHKLKHFFNLKNPEVIEAYLMILEHLKPAITITNPSYKWYKKSLKTIDLKPLRSLTFGDVTSIRNDFQAGTQQAVMSGIRTYTGLAEKEIMELGIIDFYGVISKLKLELNEISNLEQNYLVDDEPEFNFEAEAVNANQRMSVFGELGTIDFLAGKDITKWREIEKLPYMVVFTKLRMNKEENAIQREMAALHKKKNN